MVTRYVIFNNEKQWKTSFNNEKSSQGYNLYQLYSSKNKDILILSGFIIDKVKLSDKFLLLKENILTLNYICEIQCE